MNAESMIKVTKSLAGIEGGIVKKWVSHDDYEEIIIEDNEGGTYEITYKPKKKPIEY